MANLLNAAKRLGVGMVGRLVEATGSVKPTGG